MGHKVVCLNYYRVENLGTDLTNLEVGNCPLCSNKMTFANHKFRPPKKTEKKKWEVVKFLIQEGFPFHHIYQAGKSDTSKSSSDNYISYPKTMKEAKEFVIKYRNQCIILIKRGKKAA